MESKALLIDLAKDWKTQRIRLTFELEDEPTPEQIDDITGKPLRLKAVLFRKKRSLNANGYAWELMREIAQKVGSTKEEIYEIALRDVGVPYEDENGKHIIMKLPRAANIDAVPGHWRRTDGDYMFSEYILLKGSSEYDTKEMSILIDYIVEQAKSLGIDTMTPDEIARLKSIWRPESEKKCAD